MGQSPVETPAHLERAVPQWRIAQRATPWFANAIAGGAGALVAIGVIAVGIDLYPDHGHGAGWGGFALCVVMVAVGLGLVVRLPTLFESTGIAMVAIGVAAAMGFVQFPRVHQSADLRLFFAVTIVAWLLGFAVGPARARPLLLFLALLTALTWATVEVADVNANPLFGVSTSTSISSGSDGSFTPDLTAANNGVTIGSPNEPNWGELGGVSLAFGAVYLLGVAVLDTRGRRGVATAAVLPGVVAIVDAVIFFGEEAKSVVVAGLLSVAAGLFVGFVGTRSHRRFTVWTGAFGATVGAVILTAKITDSTTNGGSNTHSASVFGGFTILFGVAMVAVAAFVARVLRESPAGDDPAEAGAAAPAAPAVTASDV